VRDADAANPDDATTFVAVPDRPRVTNVARPTSNPEASLMTKPENRCANCGGRFGLVCHYHWGLRFCRKACKDKFLARTAKDHARVRKWFGFLARRVPC
jgi:hypothetical protein